MIKDKDRQSKIGKAMGGLKSFASAIRQVYRVWNVERHGWDKTGAEVLRI